MLDLRFPSHKSAVRAGLLCAAIFSVCILVTSAFAQNAAVGGPSFSCRAVPEGGVEDLICRDGDLSRQDRQMASAYRQARAAVHGSAGYGALYETQIAFLRARADCVNLRTQKGYCISDLTDKRLAELRQWTRLRMEPNGADRIARKTGTTLSARPPRGPSFSCANAMTLVERAICNDRELSLLDRQMVDALRRANADSGRKDLHLIATEQRAFLANRDRCSARTTDRRICIQVSYENRIQRLSEFQK